MGIEKIREEILQKAAEAEKEIILDAHKKADGVKKSAAESIKHLEDEASKNIRVQIKALENKELAVQNLIANKMLFEAKKDIIDKAYSKGLDKITTMPKKEREQVIKKMVERAQNEIDVSIVYANKIDADFVDKKFKVKHIDTHGGIICETSDGKIRVDYTFATIFADLKEKTIQDISKILFG